LGFYKGYRVTAIAYPIFHAFFFSTYNYMKPIIQRNFNEPNLLVVSCLSSAVAGAVSDLITNPFWVSNKLILLIFRL
jgi:hypothetical protein